MFAPVRGSADLEKALVSRVFCSICGALRILHRQRAVHPSPRLIALRVERAAALAIRRGRSNRRPRRSRSRLDRDRHHHVCYPQPRFKPSPDTPQMGRRSRSGYGLSSAKEFDHQENFPAEEALPEEGARVPCPHVDPGRGPCPQAPPPQGAQASHTRASAVKPKYRLRHSADFRAVRAERRGAGDEVLRVQVKLNSVGHPRVGIAVTKHLAGAVMRNRLRRRLRAAATGMLGELGAYDVVVFPRSPALSADSAAIRASLTRALLQAGTQR